MKRIIVVTVIISLIIAGAGYFYYSQQMKMGSIPKYVSKAEEAMAMEGLTILSHMNVEYAVKLENKIYPDGDPSPLLTSNNDALSFIKTLQNNGVDVRKQLKHALGGFYTTSQGNGGAMLFFGEFNAPKIIESLKQTYTVLEQTDDNQIIFVRKNTKTCKLSKPMHINISKDIITLASPNIMPVILERLEKQSVANVDLSKWVDFRQKHFASIGLIAPEDIGNAMPQGISRMLIKQIIKKSLPSAEDIFIGSSIKSTKPYGLTMNSIINTEDTSWINSASNKIKDARENFRNEMTETAPSLAKLDKHLSINTTEQQLKLSLILNREALDNVINTLEETTSSFFSTTSMFTASDNKQLKDEIIPGKDLPQFFNNYTHEDIPDYMLGSHHFIKADTTTGPFGIMLEKAELINSNNQRTTELTFKIDSEPIRNIPIQNLHSDGADGSAAILHINGVYDADNNSLMAIEDCGKVKNSDAQGFKTNNGYAFKDGKNIAYNYLETKKTIRLIPEANISDIAKITGSIKLDLPNGIKVEELTAPLSGKNITTKDVRLFFKKNDSDNIKYEISGQKNHILSINALNNNKQPLKNRSSTASTSVFSNGLRSVSRNIQGNVDGAEVTYATGGISKTYDFTMTSFFNHYDKKTWGKKVVVVKPDIKANFAKYGDMYDFSNFCDKNDGKLSLPPFQLCLNKINYHGKHWGVDARFSIAAPNSPALNQNLFGTEIYIDKLKVKSMAIAGRTKLISFPMNGYMPLSRKKDKQNKHSFLVANREAVRKPDPKGLLNNKEILGATGKLIIRIPKKLKSTGIYANILNSNMKSDDGSLVLIVTKLSQDSITLTAAGDVNKLVQIIPISSEKQPLPLNSVRIEKKDDTYIIEIKPVGGTPEFLNVIYATKQEKFAIPFDINQQVNQ